MSLILTPVNTLCLAKAINVFFGNVDKNLGCRY